MTPEQLCAAIENSTVLRDKMPTSSNPAPVQAIEPDTDAENEGEIYPGIKTLTTAKDGRILVALPADNRLVSDFANDLGRALSATDIFNRGVEINSPIPPALLDQNLARQ